MSSHRTAAYPQPAPVPSGNLGGRAELHRLEDEMDNDKDKRRDDVPAAESAADDGAVVDPGWAKVDLHERKKTPEADMPSDLEPPRG